MMNIPFHLPYITNNEISAVVETLKSGWLSMGNKTIEFEDKFSKYVGSKYAVSTNSCTSALFLSLKTLGIKKGDEVITTPFTFASTANTIIHCGAKPIFADIDEKTYNIDPENIKEKISDKTKAIIVVHYAGQPAEMMKVEAISKEYQLGIVEDAAHATGSCYEGGNRVGASGDLTCFSFYATKPMTTGEGGMITLNNEDLTEKLRILRLHGMSRDAWRRYTEKNTWYYELIDAGYKCNTTDMNAAIGLEQLKKLDRMNEKRKKIAEFYDENLKNFDIMLPYKNPKVKSSFHLYPVRLLNYNRNKFINEMAKKGIGTSVHFIPLHLMRYYQEAFGYKRGDFPIAEGVYKNIVSLPIYPQLTSEQLDYIVSSIRDILGG